MGCAVVAAAAKRNMTTVTVAVAPVPVPVAMVIRVIKCIDYDTVQYSVGLLLHTSAQFIRYEQYLRPHSIKVAPVAVAPVAVAPVPVDEEVPVPVVMVIRVHSSCGWSQTDIPEASKDRSDAASLFPPQSRTNAFVPLRGRRSLRVAAARNSSSAGEVVAAGGAVEGRRPFALEEEEEGGG